MPKKGKTERVRKPKNPREALVGLRTVAEHIEETLKAYRAHKLPKPVAGDDVEAYAATRGQRVQRLVDILRLRRFLRAVKVYGSAGNKKGFDQLLGLKAGRGTPVVQDRRDKILEKLLKIVLLRSAGRQWKVIGRECGMTAQAARRLVEREVSNLPEARTKKTAKDLAARMKQKLPPIGTAKARSADLGKEIAAQNRRAHEAKARRRSQSKKPAR